MSRYFRAHRGTLEDSMTTVVEINSRTELLQHVIRELGAIVTEEQLIITPYCYDGRIGWHTYIVAIKEPIEAVIGFLDGPLDETKST